MTSGRPTSPPAPTPTSPEAARRFAEALARGCAAALGRAVAGVILHGSLTLGDYLPGRSDVDLLVVVDEPPSGARLAALVEAMASRRAPAPGPVDLRLVTRQAAASPTPAPPLEAYLRLAPGSGVRLEQRRHPAERDLAVELSVCRAHGRSLLGTAPAELIGEVPDRWVVAAGDAQLADWQAIGDDPPYAELTVLTACRVWRFAEQGRHCSKAAPPTGRWGVTPPSGWVLTPSTSATATRPPGSTPRRCNSCWRCSEHGSPRRATAPSWGIPAGDADEGAGGGGDFVGGQEHGRGRHLSSRRERPSSHMASNGAGSPLTAGPLVVLGVS
jgi:predicted nucleotidyltransferase